MNELKINGRFQLVCPEGFRELTEGEREKLNTLGEGESLFLTNEEGHIAVSIGWKDVNAFAGFLLHLISPISSVEASVNRAMAPYGYRKETMLERQIGGQIAKGFRYTYTAGDTPMVGESYVIRQDRSLTFFHAYYRASERETSLPLWQGLLDAVQGL